MSDNQVKKIWRRLEEQKEAITELSVRIVDLEKKMEEGCK